MIGPRAPLPPATAAQTPMARPRSRGSWKMLVSSERVAGMMNAAPMPIEARVKISSVAPPARPDSIEPMPKMTSADHQRALATEAVAEAADGEQQPGEHQRVAVDDPLHLAGGGAEVPDQVGDGDVEDRVVEGDHQQARAEHGQRPPAPFVDLRLVHRRGRRSSPLGDGAGRP